MKRRGEEEDESGKESEIEVPYLELPNATPLGAAYHVAHSFCEVPASREAQVDTQLLRHIQAGHLLSDSKPHVPILIAWPMRQTSEAFRPLCSVMQPCA